MHKRIRNKIRNVNHNNKEIHTHPTILPTSTNTNLDDANQPKINMNKINKKYTYRKPTTNSKQQTQHSPNTKQNNVLDNESHEINNKNKENNIRSEIPRSKKLLPGTNNIFSSNLRNISEERKSTNVPSTDRQLLSSLYNKLNDSTKIQSDTITKAEQNINFGIKIQIHNSG